MKNIDILSMVNALDSVKDISGIELTYAICKNRQMLVKERDDIQVTATPTDDFIKYQREMQKVFDASAVQINKNGEGIVNFEVPESKEVEYIKQVDDLKIDYRDVIAAREQQIADYNKFLQKVVKQEFEFHLIKKSDLPKDIKAVQMDALIDFLDEDAPDADEDQDKGSKEKD